MDTKTLHVLIIDDSEDDALLLTHELECGGWDVNHRIAETREEMELAFKEQNWNLIISDYAMPDFSASSVLNLLSEWGEDIPAIIVSGEVGEEVAVQLMKNGAHDYVNKNNLTRLCAVVERELEEAKTRKEHRILEAERKHIERQLQQAQKMEAIGQLTGGIAHDFNNILASIMGYTGLALERCVDGTNPKLMEYLEEVFRAGERARDLISQMLTFSRSETDEAKPLDLGPLVKEAMKLLTSTLPSSIELVTHIEEEVPQVEIDPVQVQQILMNLCINARDAMNSNGQLKISLQKSDNIDAICTSCHISAKGDFVELSIEDNGPGILPDVVTRMFNPFYTTKDVGKGTGMGLSMVHGIVHEHGGHILVETSPQHGTCFSILLPESNSSNESSPTKQCKPKLLTTTCCSGQILVIDDEASVAGFICELLENYGFDVIVETNSIKALALFTDTPDKFDMVITDQTMPRLTGAEVSRRMLTVRPDLPIILCTGYSEQMDEKRAQEIGIQGYLTKPIQPRILVEEVCKSLQHHSDELELLRHT